MALVKDIRNMAGSRVTFDTRNMAFSCQSDVHLNHSEAKDEPRFVIDPTLSSNSRGGAEGWLEELLSLSIWSFELFSSFIFRNCHLKCYGESHDISTAGPVWDVGMTWFPDFFANMPWLLRFRLYIIKCYRGRFQYPFRFTRQNKNVVWQKSNYPSGIPLDALWYWNWPKWILEFGHKFAWLKQNFLNRGEIDYLNVVYLKE